jgi:AcrR family transcriptional regulator
MRTGDRVRLRRAYAGLAAGSDGIVCGPDAARAGTLLVAFESGVVSVPNESLADAPVPPSVALAEAIRVMGLVSANRGATCGRFSPGSTVSSHGTARTPAKRQMSMQPGLRERKKQRTRETIARVALELFEERGYQATTLDDIAGAADVSTRTIFSYYPSKEDILFCDFPDMEAALVRALDERPHGTDALDTVRDFILSFEKDDLHPRRVQVVRSDATLHGRERARLSELAEIVAAAIARDLNAPDDLSSQLVAASLVAAFEAFDECPDTVDAPEDLGALIDPVFAFLRGGLAAMTTPVPKQ